MATSYIPCYEAATSLLPSHYLVALMQFFVFFELHACRISTSISVVGMVNNSAVSSHKISNVTAVSASTNTSEYERKTISEVNMEGEFDWSPIIQGYVLGSSFFGTVLTQIPGALLAESCGAKITFVSGLFLSSMGHLLSPFAARLNSSCMIVMQFLRGAGQGLLPAAQCVLASNWFPKTERGFLNSFVMSGYSVGALVSGLLAGSMCSSSLMGGWSSVYYVYGCLGLLLCLWIHVFLYETPKGHPRIKDSELNYILQNQETDMSKKRPPTPWKKIFTSVPVYALMYAFIGPFWIASHFLSVQPIYLGTILNFSIEQNGFYSSVPFVFQILLTLTSGWISKWLNTHNYVGVDKLRKGCTLLCCLVYSLSLLGVYFAGYNRAWSCILSIAAMSSVGFTFAGCVITPQDMTPNFAGTLMGISSIAANILSTMFPVLVGFMTNEEQTVEQWNKIFMICIGLVMSSGIVFCLFGSAEVQTWNFASTDEVETKC